MRACCGLALVLLAGCGGVRPCRSGTVFITASFAPAVLDADTVDLAITVDGKTVNATRSHTADQVTEKFEITFSTYPAGRTLAIDIVARRGGVVIGMGHVAGSLGNDCTPLSVTVEAFVPLDGSVGDFTGGDAMGDTAALDGGGDSATLDLLLPDLTPPPDLVVPDITLPGDQAMPDLTPPSELSSPPPDLSSPSSDLSSPPPDLTVLPPPDLAPPRDLASPCGRLGTPCCAGVCSDGKSVCLNAQCTTCGGMGDLCCLNQACGMGTACVQGKCAPCGSANQPCCGGVCSDGKSMCLNSNCAACGALGQPCCGGVCSDGKSICANGNCVACGALGQPCCGGNACAMGGVCASNVCACGKIGQPCCANATCDGGVGCNKAMSKCASASCDGLASTCGPNNNETCCSTAMPIPGGMFNRGNDPMYPATVSGFNLDKYEITVGRFRKFVDAGYGTQAKAPGDKAGGGVMAGTGWDAASWNGALVVDTPALKTAVKCGAGQTWADMPGGNENRPMNCITWYEAFAFCIWDGGRLSTEAEWNYAAAGGGEQREYPWSNPPNAKTIDATYAVYSVGQSEVVGSKSSKGDGKWGHADLAGNMWEWTFDWHNDFYVNPCSNCAYLNPTLLRVFRGGTFGSAASDLLSSHRRNNSPEIRGSYLGARCARSAP